MLRLTARPERVVRRILRPDTSEISAPDISRLKLCPVCGQTHLRFVPGPSQRPNAKCPSCSSLERHRALWIVFHLYTRLFEGAQLRLLHVAPEPFFRERLRTLGGLHYVSVDALREDVDLQANIEDLPVEDGAFDLVLCSHVLEHVADDRRAMAEFRRVLAPNGHAIINVPLRSSFVTDEDPTVRTPEERKRRFGQEDHLRWYGWDIVDRLQQARFHVETFNPELRLPRSMFDLMGLSAEPIFDCRGAATRD